MLFVNELRRISVVLVRARNPANIGAVARAMHDFGFQSLRVVNEFPVPFEAARSAVDASAVMQSAVSYASVADAVADCNLVIGTTAVGERELRHELLPLASAAVRIRTALGDGETRVAILFGSEKTGLSNEELSYCHWLLTIPMHGHEGLRHASMNLGQATAVCLYELVREAMPNAAPNAAMEVKQPSAPAASLERITALLQQVCEATEYTRRHAANSDPANVRRLVRRIGIDPVDAPIWAGIFRQILWKLGGTREP